MQKGSHQYGNTKEQQRRGDGRRLARQRHRKECYASMVHEYRHLDIKGAPHVESIQAQCAERDWLSTSFVAFPDPVSINLVYTLFSFASSNDPSLCKESVEDSG